ncbi:aspartyl/glutamyl-tRNA amidotransferase subunit A [candidate division WWE3 bacterium RIFCSPHIGHO2_01_FULL_48_15]|uniref:Glutamyl-tRNA(Gln) amidotransferase subunit A n=1 Tax=candidate division WWE3 bacterium RIFCSPHIGHO2_01_FULL_48_15 TaxID=1802619 RepID=A0A1F4VFT2_UNCKA|nr:MAG: aspartyl/glutamyl-tRNA amidotransferase subunit A [candidate division WWE3 bacterium RIFCSPHIGHO2_01_FULL_48_15]
MEITDLSLRQIAGGIGKKEFSAVEVLQAFLKNIEKKEVDLNAFITVFAERALQQAKAVRPAETPGKGGRLLGVPMAIKDNIVTRGLRTTAGSRMLEEYIPQYDATVVAKLNAEGAIILGKTNLDEFAMGASTENSAFGATRNPYDPERVPGGSSGGSAAAVAARFVPAALGSDTGGSVRQPAAFCGVVGLRPTYGVVSRYGLIAMASSLDQIGSLAKTVEDAQLLFEVIKGKDPYDATTVEVKSSKLIGINNLRVGLPKEYLGEGLDQKIAQRVKSIAKFLEDQGARIEEISLPHTEYGLPAYYLIVPSEVSANLARYDGIRYGYLAKADELPDLYLSSRGEGFGEEVKRRIILGTFALSSGYVDQYYLRAAKARTLIADDFEKAFKKVDLLLTPTTPSTAFKIGEKKDPLSMYLSDLFTIPANLAGLPGLSVPAGLIDGLPVGVQLIGPKFSENLLFEVGKVTEKCS